MQTVHGKDVARRGVHHLLELSPRHKRRRLVPALLRVNKQVSREAKSYLYDQSLQFRDFSTLNDFLNGMPRRRVEALRQIKVYSPLEPRRQSRPWTWLSEAKLLRSIELGFFDFRRTHDTERLEGLALKLYQSFEFWLKLYGEKHGRKDAGVDLLKIENWSMRPLQAFGPPLDQEEIRRRKDVIVAELKRLVLDA